MHMLNDSTLNVAIISLSMYKIKAFIKKKKKFVSNPSFDIIHDWKYGFLVKIESRRAMLLICLSKK